MMSNFKVEWDQLFLDKLTIMVKTKSTLGGEVVQLIDDCITIGGVKISAGTKTIIDDILIWGVNLAAILIYLECVCQVFQKYRVSFRLDKCRFLMDRVEYVGHDLTSIGNCPASSKFDLIKDWSIPISGSSLYSFIGLIFIYHIYAPYLEVRLKPLRFIVKKYFRTTIPSLAWNNYLIASFQDLKIGITSSHVLARYD